MVISVERVTILFLMIANYVKQKNPQDKILGVLIYIIKLCIETYEPPPPSPPPSSPPAAPSAPSAPLLPAAAAEAVSASIWL